MKNHLPFTTMKHIAQYTIAIWVVLLLSVLIFATISTLLSLEGLDTSASVIIPLILVGTPSLISLLLLLHRLDPRIPSVGQLRAWLGKEKSSGQLHHSSPATTELADILETLRLRTNLITEVTSALYARQSLEAEREEVMSAGMNSIRVALKAQQVAMSSFHQVQHSLLETLEFRLAGLETQQAHMLSTYERQLSSLETLVSEVKELRHSVEQLKETQGKKNSEASWHHDRGSWSGTDVSDWYSSLLNLTFTDISSFTKRSHAKRSDVWQNDLESGYIGPIFTGGAGKSIYLTYLAGSLSGDEFLLPKKSTPYVNQPVSPGYLQHSWRLPEVRILLELELRISKGEERLYEWDRKDNSARREPNWLQPPQ